VAALLFGDRIEFWRRLALRLAECVHRGVDVSLAGRRLAGPIGMGEGARNTYTSSISGGEYASPAIGAPLAVAHYHVFSCLCVFFSFFLFLRFRWFFIRFFFLYFFF
jgi:hypothetical protein